MKFMHKVLTLFTAVVLCAGLSVTGVHANTTYSITVTNKPTETNLSIEEKTFNAYKIFDVTNSGANYAYSITNSETNPWFHAVLLYMGSTDNSSTAATPDTSGKYTGKGITLTPSASNSKKYIVETGDAFSAVDFAGWLTNWLNTQNTGTPATPITADGTTSTITTNNSVQSATISLTEPGYYLVTGEGKTQETDKSQQQTVVASSILDTASPAVTVSMKAHAPTVDKDIVNADSATSPNTDGKGTAVHVGDQVTFKLTSEVPDTTGYSSYTFKLEDTLSDGLTLDLNAQGGVDFNVTVSRAASGNTEAASYTVTLDKAESLGNLTENSYFIASGNKTIYISLNVMDNRYKAGDTITITYTATLNEGALSTDKETNTVKLTYSNNPTNSNSFGETPEKKVYVYDFDIVIDKYTGSKTGGQRLSGAEFVLLNADKDRFYQGVWSYSYTSGEDTVTVYSADGKAFYSAKKLTGETVTLPDNTTPTKGKFVTVNWVDSVNQATHVITDDRGAASFQGLDSGSHHLRETVAPDGYNLLKEDQAVTIDATYAADGTLSLSSATKTGNGQYKQTQPVLNNTGAELPDTGGMGTTLFYIAGGILVLGTVVLLVTRKRMENEAE